MSNAGKEKKTPPETGIKVKAKNPEKLKMRAELKELKPATDLRESPEEFFIAVELPGLSRKDVSITMNISEITIRARKRPVKGLKKETSTIQEIEEGIYLRTIPLPDTVEPKKAKTSMKNGLLTMVMPRKDYDKAVKISLKQA